ncbi:phosphate acyltransferase PlsX [bacterium]|nr:phosphate acyltransferase PlsX [bacterium]
MLPIAVDTAGSDLGISALVEGAVAAKKEANADSLLIGPEQEILRVLEGLGAKALNLAICDAQEVITMEDSPARAVRSKQNSSLVKSFQQVVTGQAAAVISAGNSGAMMTAGVLHAGLLPAIERPAIASVVPIARNQERYTVVLDVGANVGCNAHHLVQFGIMGSVYYRSLFNVEQPRVALLSNGAEASKGTDVIRAAAHTFKTLKSVNYIGYVEGRDFGTDAADVVVCDGFVGNVILKTLEGCVQMVAEELKHGASQSLRHKFGFWLSRDLFTELFRGKFDYRSAGGAPLLGLKELAIVLHGSSNQRAVKHAILKTREFVDTKMTEKIEIELAKFEENGLGLSHKE